MNRIAIDISHYDGSINFKQVKASGQECIFIKATESTSDIDPRFFTNWQQAKDANLLISPYHFFRLWANPITQAEHFIHQLSLVGYDPKIELPPAMDLEDTTLINLKGKAKIRESVTSFLNVLKMKYSIYPFIYGSPSYLNQWLGDGYGGHPLWIAHYDVKTPTIPQGWHDYAIWQYTDNAILSDIGTGFLDVNRLNPKFTLPNKGI